MFLYFLFLKQRPSPTSATTAHLCNHRRVVSMRQKCSKCVGIKFLNKTLKVLLWNFITLHWGHFWTKFASFPRKHTESCNRLFFWMLFHWNVIKAMIRHSDFSQFSQSQKKKAPVTNKLQSWVGFLAKP